MQTYTSTTENKNIEFAVSIFFSQKKIFFFMESRFETKKND